MRTQSSTGRRAAAGLGLALVLAANTGCISLDYADWVDFNNAVVGGAIDATGSFVEATWSELLAGLFQGLTGMSDG